MAINGKKNGKPDNLATVMTEVSERVTVLVREELELAKAEVQEKVKSLGKGLIAGAIGGVFALLFIPFGLMTLAWGLNSAFSSIWLGFLIVTGLLLLLMGGAFLFAWRKLKVGAPAPKMAIEEAKKIRETVAAKGNGSGNGNGALAPVPLAAIPVAPAPVIAAPAPVVPEPVTVGAPAPAVPEPDAPIAPAPEAVAPAAPDAPTVSQPVVPADDAPAETAESAPGETPESE